MSIVFGTCRECKARGGLNREPKHKAGCRYETVKQFNQRVLDEGAESADGLPGVKHYTVVGVYVHGDAANIGEKFADYVDAESWTEAMQQVKTKRGDEMQNNESPATLVAWRGDSRRGRAVCRSAI